MIVKAKYAALGVTMGKEYDVIEVLDYINSYRVALDDGTVAVRHKCGFDIVK